MIILTKAEADRVRGPTANNSALMPVELVNETFALPENVLRDDSHAVHHSFLSGLPVREVRDDEWKVAQE